MILAIPELAVRIYGASDLELQLSRHGHMPDEDEATLADIGRLREELGEPVFTSRWEAGRGLSYEVAMEEASAALDEWEVEMRRLEPVRYLG